MKKSIKLIMIMSLLFFASCSVDKAPKKLDLGPTEFEEIEQPEKPTSQTEVVLDMPEKENESIVLEAPEEEKITVVPEEKYKKAIFAGGCFWCSESDFEKLNGVVDVISGYAGGTTDNPTYKLVSAGKTDYREAVLVYYDSKLITYDELLDAYWRHIDPTDDEGSFVDRGFQYTSAIFYFDDMQKLMAEQSKAHIDDSGRFEKPVVTKILPYTTFYQAEDYHQDYHTRNPIRYKYYRGGSGRDDFIEKNWKIDDVLLGLSSLQYHVTQENGTEKPFDNEYWDNKREGIYVDIISGEPLFSSKHKYVSGTGWPSFDRPLVPENIIEVEDNSFFMKRIDIRGKKSNAHIGHVFNDGPKESTGLRYCMNSAALRFIPKEDLEKEGYGDFVKDFE